MAWPSRRGDLKYQAADEMDEQHANNIAHVSSGHTKPQDAEDNYGTLNPSGKQAQS